MQYILLEATTPVTATETTGQAANEQTQQTIEVDGAPNKEEETKPTGFGSANILFFVAIFAIMYFLMIRPQQKKQKETQQMLNGLQENDKVITVSGIIGRIISFKPDKDIVVIEIDDKNKIRVEFQRSAIAGLIKPTESDRS
ncbi:MAG: preprotein translocase subunit YajC [Candidatus Cloacimonetes bacterium]|nr:preprotein translocase subunit YajC [Candidatus Cloacimonadota bacterium]